MKINQKCSFNILYKIAYIWFLAFSLVFPVFPDVHYWDGEANNDFFDSSLNWDNDQPLISTDDYHIDGFTEPYVDNSVSASVSRLKVGVNSVSNSLLTMDGGTIYADGHVFLGESAGSKGTLVIDDGSFSTPKSIHVGFYGYGKLTINEGNCSWRSGYDYYFLYINEQDTAGDGGLVELFGGTLSGASLSIGTKGLLHIKEGMLILDNDCTAQIESLVHSDLIVAYEGFGQVIYDYDQTTAGKTTVYALPPQVDQTYEWQHESGQNVSVSEKDFEITGNGSVSKLFKLNFDSNPCIKLNLSITGESEFSIHLADSMGNNQAQVRGPVVIDNLIYLDPLATLGWQGENIVKVIFNAIGSGTVAVHEQGPSYLAHDFLFPADSTTVQAQLGPDSMCFRWPARPGATSYTVEYWQQADPQTVYSVSVDGQCFAYPASALTQGLWKWRVKSYNGQLLIYTSPTWSFNHGPGPASTASFVPISLDVKNFLYFERQEVLSSGVPFPKGQFFIAQPVGLFNAEQNECDLQLDPLAFWQDGSVKWALLSFTADVPAGASSVYELRPIISEPPAAMNLAQVQNDRIEIDTTALQSSIPFVGFNPMGDCTVNGSVQMNCPVSFRIGAILGDQPTEPVTEYSAVAGLSSSCLEENGPLRAVICTRGPMHDGQGNEGFSYILRQIYRKGQSDVRLELTFICKTGTLVRGGVITTVLLKYVTLDIGGLSPLNYTFDPDTALEPTGSSTFILNQSSHDSYSIIEKDQYNIETVIATGSTSQGICITDTLGVGIKKYWQQFPKRILVNQDSISLELWSEDYSQPRRFATGSAKTHEIIISLTDNTIQAGEVLQSKDVPLYAVCDPNYYMETKALLDMPEISSDTQPVDDALQVNLDDVMAYRDREDCFSMVNYGDVGELGSIWWNSEVDMHKGALIQFLRTGNLSYLDFGIDMSRHNMDVDVCHYHPDNYMFVGGHCGHSDDHTTNTRFPYPSHTWLRGYLLDYYLTGYRRALDIAHETAKGLVNAVTNDGVVHPYANKDAGSTGREFGHTLRNLSELSWYTGNDYYKSTMKKVAACVMSGAEPDGSLPEYCSGTGTWSTGSFPDNKGGHYSSLALMGIEKYSRFAGDTSTNDFIENFCNWDIGCGSVPYKLGFYYHGAQGQDIWHDVDATSSMLPVYAHLAEMTGKRRYLDIAQTLYDNIIEYEWNWQSYKKIVDARALYYFLDIKNSASFPTLQKAPQYDSFRTINYLRSLQNADGGFACHPGSISDTESTCRALQALALLEDDKFDDIGVLNYIRSCRKAAEGYSSQQGWITDSANTYFSLASLKILGENPVAQSDLEQWLRECQNYRSGELGGFGSSPRPSEYYGLNYIGYFHNWESSVQYTYFSLCGLETLELTPVNSTMAQNFLNSYIHPDGGARCGVWSRSTNAPRDVLSTYWILRCFEYLGMDPATGWKDKTIQYLRGLQQLDGGFSWQNGRVSTVRHTWLCTKSLEILNSVPFDQAGLKNFLNQCANKDGGFGDRPSMASDVLSTYYAVSMLGYRRTATFTEDLIDFANEWLNHGQLQILSPQLNYRFNETSGQTANDASGDADGILHDFPLDDSQWVSGHSVNALSFDGINDWVDIPDNKVTDFYNKTISFWLNFSSLPSTGFIIGSGAAYPLWVILNSDGTISATVQSESMLSSPLSPDVFHHIALIIEQDSASKCSAYFYIDGQLQGSKSDKDIHSGVLSGINLGSYNDGISSFTSFVIDEFRIYDQALEEADIEALAGGQEIYQTSLNSDSDWNGDGRIDYLDFSDISQIWNLD